MLQRLTVECVGTSPLLMNAMSQEQLLALWNKEKAPRGKERPAPKVHCEAVMYRDRKGNPIIPGPNLYSALVDAGRFVRLEGKKQVSTRKDTVMPSFLTLEGTEFPVLQLTGKKAAQWEVDIRKGTNPNGGEAVAIVRPMFIDWRFIFTAQIDLDEISESALKQLVEYSGTRIGLCDFRPARKGPFGMFSVKKWAVSAMRKAA